MLDMKDLKDKRIALGLTQIELAIRVGVTLNTYRNWELGANNPSDENKLKLEEALKKK